MSCLSCVRGFHEECDDYNFECNNCCCSIDTDSYRDSAVQGNEETERNSRRRADDSVSISAGRKRAAVDYPLDPLVPCEWRGKTNCGGGFVPITGCVDGFQEARHHGPDKNTTNNDEDNVNLICTSCHNTWHRRNDPKYNGDKCPEGIQLNEPRWMTKDELRQAMFKAILK